MYIIGLIERYVTVCRNYVTVTKLVGDEISQPRQRRCRYACTSCTEVKIINPAHMSAIKVISLYIV